MIYLTADEHYWHYNIIKYCNRPFKNVEHMSEVLITNHNTLVSKEDEVYHIGDFSMNQWAVEKVLKRLNGIHFLIVGGHDRPYKKSQNHISIQNYKEWGFKEIWESYFLTYLDVTFWLAHIPLNYVDYNTKRNLKRPKPEREFDLVLHGHRHSKPENKLLMSTEILQFDVGVDGNNYFPYNIEEILKVYKEVKLIEEETK